MVRFLTAFSAYYKKVNSILCHILTNGCVLDISRFLFNLVVITAKELHFCICLTINYPALNIICYIVLLEENLNIRLNQFKNILPENYAVAIETVAIIQLKWGN